ncbi:CPBP family intramembrane glutamic endopeptidase [Nocardiopsis coralliicola]
MANDTAARPQPPAPSAPATPADPSRTTVLPARGLAPYFLITFAFSWTVWWLGSFPQAQALGPMPFVVVGSFGPMVGAVLVTLANHGPSGVGALFRRLSPFRGGLVPYLIGFLVVAAIAASAAGPVLLEGAGIDQPALQAALATAPIQFLVIALAGGGNEELGWRGFAQPRLQGALPPLAANVVLGLIWAVWHAPVFHMAGTMQSEMYFPAYTLLCVALTVVLGHVFNASRGGVFAAVVVHAAINTVSGLKGAAVFDPAGPTEVAAVGLVALLLFAVTKGRLAPRRPNPHNAPA